LPTLIVVTSTDAQRFDAVTAHPLYPEAMAWSPPSPGMLEIGLAIFMMVAGLVGLDFVYRGYLLGGRLLPIHIILFAVAWFGILGWVLVRAIRFYRAPVDRTVAVVIDERTRVDGGGNDTSAHTHYYVTLQLRDGFRFEREADGHLAGLVTRGDAGLAYTKGDQLLFFRRFPV
jgi:hypothetical protein